MQTTDAPLIVRLSDLPDLGHDETGHGVRATLTVARLRHVAAAQLRDEDRAQATGELYAAHEPVQEFVRTAEVSMEKWTDELLKLGLLVDTNPRRRRKGLRLLLGGAR
jgi:hypothetical protein